MLASHQKSLPLARITSHLSLSSLSSSSSSSFSPSTSTSFTRISNITPLLHSPHRCFNWRQWLESKVNERKLAERDSRKNLLFEELRHITGARTQHYHRTGGKPYLTPKEVLEPCNAPVIPANALKGIRITDEKEIIIPEDIKGKVTLLTLAYNKEAMTFTNDWIRLFDIGYADEPIAACYQVNIVGTKSIGFLKRWILSNMRKDPTFSLNSNHEDQKLTPLDPSLQTSSHDVLLCMGDPCDYSSSDVVEKATQERFQIDQRRKEEQKQSAPSIAPIELVMKDLDKKLEDLKTTSTSTSNPSSSTPAPDSQTSSSTSSSSSVNSPAQSDDYDRLKAPSLSLSSISKMADPLNRPMMLCTVAQPGWFIYNKLAAHILLIDAKGRIRWRAVGPIQQDEEREIFIKCMDRLIDEAKNPQKYPERVVEPVKKQKEVSNAPKQQTPQKTPPVGGGKRSTLVQK